MKPNKPNFWIVIAAVYFVILCAFIFIYNPDFHQVKNYLLFLPLYAPLIVALNIIHKNDEDGRSGHWAVKSAMICATVLVVVVKIIADKIR